MSGDPGRIVINASYGLGEVSRSYNSSSSEKTFLIFFSRHFVNNESYFQFRNLLCVTKFRKFQEPLPCFKVSRTSPISIFPNYFMNLFHYFRNILQVLGFKGSFLFRELRDLSRFRILKIFYVFRIFEMFYEAQCKMIYVFSQW